MCPKGEPDIPFVSGKGVPYDIKAEIWSTESYREEFDECKTYEDIPLNPFAECNG